MKHALSGVLHESPSVTVQLRCRRTRRRTCGRAAVGVPLVCAFLAAILGLGLHVNLTASAPRGLYRAIAEPPARGALVVACVSPAAAVLGHARGYLGPGSCPGGVAPVLKPVVAVAGDVVELRPDVVMVNGRRLPDSAWAVVDRLGRPLPHAVWGRYVVAADELWLASTRVANSWDSRYLGPFSGSQVRALAVPVMDGRMTRRPGRRTEPQVDR